MMLALIALLAIVNIKPKVDGDYIEGGGSSSVGSSSKPSGLLTALFQNLNDFLNSGLNKAHFKGHFDDESVFFDGYHTYINYVLNKSYVPFPHLKDEGYYTKFFSVDQTLYKAFPKFETYMKENAELFKEVKTIVSELGPDLARAANINFNTIQSLYDYVVINNQKDGVKFGEIFKILGISTNFVPQVQKIVSVFDDNKPMSVLFEGINVKNEYETFLGKLAKLDVPKDDTTRFLSLNLAADAFSSFCDLVRAAYNNCLKAYYDDPLLKVIKNYALKSANIFEVSIYDRATSFKSVLDKMQKYSNSCTNEEEEFNLKCLIYSTAKEYMRDMFCEIIDYDYDTYEDIYDPECVPKVFDIANDYVSDYTKPEINLTDILIKKYHIKENYVRSYAGLASDVFDSTKSYLDILKRTTSIVGDFNISNWPYQDFVSLISKTVDFIDNLNGNSNFKNIFDLYDLKYYWNQFSEIVEEIKTEKPICNLSTVSYYEYEKCQSLNEQVKSVIDGILKDATFEQLEVYQAYINIGIPILKSFDQPLSKFLDTAYERAYPLLKDMFGENVTIAAKVQFSNSLTQLSTIAEKLITLIDDLFPLIVKELPVVNQYYPSYITKSREIITSIKNNASPISLANTCYDGIGVIFQFLGNAAKAYTDEKTKIITLLEAAKPTSFLNVKETLTKLNQLKTFTLKGIAESITFDNSNAVAKLLADARVLSVNDIAPFKSIIKHSNELFEELTKNRLTLEMVSKCLAASQDKIKSLFTSIASPLHSVPQKYIQRSYAFYFRDNENNANSLLEKIRSIASSIAAGRMITTQTGSIVVTPQATPAQTLPPIDDGFNEVADGETIDTSDVTSGDEIKDLINKEANKDQNSNTALIWDDPDKKIPFDGIDLKGNSLKLPNGGTIDYSNGELNLKLDSGNEPITINTNKETISLSLNNVKNAQESTVSIVTEQKKVKIDKKSDLASPVVIKVSNTVTNVEIDSVKLYSGGKISAQKEDNGKVTPVTVTVNNLDASANTVTSLSNVIVNSEFKVTQSAIVDLDNVDLSKSTLNLDVKYSYNNNAFLTGNLKAAPKDIVLQNIQNAEGGKPGANANYILFDAKFDDCDSWKKILQNKIGETGFDYAECAYYEPGASAFILESKNAQLNLRKEPKKDSKKLTTAQIAGIVVGCVAAVAIIVIVVVVVVLKKKKGAHSSGEDEDNGKGKNDDDDNEL